MSGYGNNSERKMEKTRRSIRYDSCCSQENDVYIFIGKKCLVNEALANKRSADLHLRYCYGSIITAKTKKEYIQ